MSTWAVLVKAKNRQYSQDAADVAYMQHWQQCRKDDLMPQGSTPCTRFELCPTGAHLDALCPVREMQPLTSFDIFLILADDAARQERHRSAEEFAAYASEARDVKSLVDAIAPMHDLEKD